MQLQDQIPGSNLLPTQPAEIDVKIRTQPRGCVGRVFLVSVALLIGIALGVAGSLFYALVLSSDQPLLTIPTSSTGNIVIQMGSSFLTPLIEKRLRTAGMPGKISSVQVQLAHGSLLTIGGYDEFSLAGAIETRYFTIKLQPYVDACQLQLHVIHMDLSNIPVTRFATSFEKQMNQQLQLKPGTLPGSSAYCAVGVHTEPSAMFVSYTAIPA